MQEAAIQPKSFLSDKVEHFTESVIREMTRQAMLYGAVNLAQGFPDFPRRARSKNPPRKPSRETSISTRSLGAPRAFATLSGAK